MTYALLRSRYHVVCDHEPDCMHVLTGAVTMDATQTLAESQGWQFVEGLALCPDHVEPTLPHVARGELCAETWCTSRTGHLGSCVVVPQWEHAHEDFGPEAAKRRRY